MTRVKRLARLLPPPLRRPVRAVWRKIRGNAEFHLLRLLSDPKKIAIDVGANYGIYTVRLARAAKACVAFEPNPPVATAARERAAASGLGNVEVHACALSNQDTEVTFRVPVVNGVESDALATIEADNALNGADVHSYTVPCHRLDGFEFDPVGVIKIDAEGHEGAILDGARSLIERDHPAVMIEVEERHKHGSVDYVRQFFAAYGYEGYFLRGRQLVPLDEFDAEADQSTANFERGKVRLDAVYVNNFVFAADERRIAMLNRIAHSGRSL